MALASQASSKLFISLFTKKKQQSYWWEEKFAFPSGFLSILLSAI